MQELRDDDYVTKNQVANEGNVHVWVNVINMEDFQKVINYPFINSLDASTLSLTK